MLCSPLRIDFFPQVVLDQPTKGMDIFDTFFLVEYLRQWAGRGRIVIMTLQPPTYEILTMISKVLLLSTGSYQGPLGLIEGEARIFNRANQVWCYATRSIVELSSIFLKGCPEGGGEPGIFWFSRAKGHPATSPPELSLKF